MRAGFHVAVITALALSFSAVGPGTASAQGESADEEELEVDPETGARYRRVRPEPGLRRGELDVDAWVPIALGGGALLFAGVVLGLAAFRRKRARR
jgi:hypothetical protein